MNPEGINRINCHEIITSENYVDIYQRLTVDVEEKAKAAGAECVQNLTEENWIFHIKVDQEECDAYYNELSYMVIPNIYGLSSMSSIDASGIGPILKNKSLDITGKGVIVAIMDTGIDYTHEAFIYEDNTSKILSLWDQTQQGNPPEGFLYGAEYSNEQINEALKLEDPLSMIPSTDEVGHGTFLAGIATGRTNRKKRFQGAAPDADLVIVKLKQAKKCLMSYYQFKEDAVGFQSNDIMQGLNYLKKKAKEFGKPMVILFTGASTEGPHNGSVFLERELAYYGNTYGVVAVIAAGNEGNAAHHYHGRFEKGEKKVNVALNISNKDRGLFFNMWSVLPDELTIELISPSGETTGKVPFISDKWQEIVLLLEATKILVFYEFIEERGGEEAIYVRMINPMPGIWTIAVYGEFILNGEFDIWLPVSGLIDSGTIFLQPDPNITIVNPSSNAGTVTVGAYDEVFNSIYLASSRGYTKDGMVKPDLVAPGVNVIGPYPKGAYGVLTGTSASAGITAGASALLLEWGIVKGNDTALNTVAVKTYLIRGAKRRENIDYPNREWGFGELDLLNTYNVVGTK